MTYCIVAATFVGSAYVLMTRGHVNVDILPLHVGPRTRYWLALFTIVLALGFCVVLLGRLHAILVRGLVGRAGIPTRCGARGCGFRYLSMPIGLGLLVLQYIAELLCLVTGRAPPFGIKPTEDAEEFARAQAKQALGEAP